MRTYVRAVFAVVVAATALAVATTVATAATINISPGGAIDMPSLGRVTFSGGVLNVRCSVTMKGNLVTSVAATAGARLGTISGFEVSTCEGGNIRGILNLAWSITFSRLTASGLEATFQNFSINLSVIIFGIVTDCLYSGPVPFLRRISAAATELILVLSNRLEKVSGFGSCPASISLAGSFGLTQQTITLT